MINADPLRRLMAENEISNSQLAQLSGLSEHDISVMLKGKKITKTNLELLCKILKCQPCDIIEYSKSDSKGHWVYIPED